MLRSFRSGYAFRARSVNRKCEHRKFIFRARHVEAGNTSTSTPQHLNTQTSFLKDEIHRQDEKNKSDEMIQLQSFIPEKDDRKNNKYGERDHFLDHFELNK